MIVDSRNPPPTLLPAGQPADAIGSPAVESQGKRIIGRTERVDFPVFGLAGIEAKVDTGARTSSIHCADVVVEEELEDGRRHITFTLLDPEHPGYDGRRFRAQFVGTRVVRSSNGEEQERHVIETDVVVAGERIRTQFTLADREAMTYPVLLGRRLLRGSFLVDVSLRRRRAAATLSEEE